jgi:hypothetical protein
VLDKYARGWFLEVEFKKEAPDPIPEVRRPEPQNLEAYCLVLGIVGKRKLSFRVPLWWPLFADMYITWSAIAPSMLAGSTDAILTITDEVVAYATKLCGVTLKARRYTRQRWGRHGFRARGQRE